MYLLDYLINCLSDYYVTYIISNADVCNPQNVSKCEKFAFLSCILVITLSNAATKLTWWEKLLTKANFTAKDRRILIGHFKLKKVHNNFSAINMTQRPHHRTW